MSFVRTSRLLVNSRFAAGSVVRNAGLARFKSTGTPEDNVPAASPVQAGNSSQRGVTPNVAETRRQAEGGIPIDYGTNAYSPVTTTPVHRGPNDPLAANVISGAPVELQGRTVRIYKPAKNATQSGHYNGRQWKMDWDVLSRGHRWENPLMGWQSSGDFMQGTHLFFKSKEDAIAFAEKQGYEWFVQEPNVREFRSKNYAANFTHSPKKLKIVRTK